MCKNSEQQPKAQDKLYQYWEIHKYSSISRHFSVLPLLLQSEGRYWIKAPNKQLSSQRMTPPKEAQLLEILGIFFVSYCF